jgi:hypothetical protein
MMMTKKMAANIIPFLPLMNTKGKKKKRKMKLRLRKKFHPVHRISQIKILKVKKKNMIGMITTVLL